MTGGGTVHVVGISGDYGMSSVQRVGDLIKVADIRPGVTFGAVRPADWDQARARSVATRLPRRATTSWRALGR